MEDKLTILILTYNRKERLLQQLESIYRQPEIYKVNVLIVDNYSDYDVESTIRNHFDENTLKNIEVKVNPINIGMHANLAMTFLNCKTKWMWTLGDDDETKEGSIATVLNDIESYPDTVLFKYHIEGSGAYQTQEFKAYNDTDVTSIEQLLDFYYSTKLNAGHLVFLSNNVYNVEIAMKYYGMTLSHCYCDVAQLLPMFYALKNKAGVVRFREHRLVNFKQAEKGNCWPHLSTAVEISTFSFFDFGLNIRDYKRLWCLIMSGFSHYGIILAALNEPDRKRGEFLYKQIYSRSFSCSGRLLDKLYYIFYHICYYTHFQVSADKALVIRDKVRKVFPSFR